MAYVSKNGLSYFWSGIKSKMDSLTFYGLAKAAGDTTQALSNNAVGTYTDDAKTAIKSMIGVPTMSEIITAVQDSYTAAEEVSF